MNILNFFSILSLFVIFSLTPSTLSANHSITSTYGQFSIASGGLVVIAIGLVESPIEIEFEAQKNANKSQDIQVMIFADDGGIRYQEQNQSATIDLSKLSLTAGSYSLVVVVDGVAKTAEFSIL